MRLPNGYGSVVKMSGKRRKPYMVRKTIGWHLDETKGRQIQDFQIIGYAETRAEGLRMLAEYNQNTPALYLCFIKPFRFRQGYGPAHTPALRGLR